MCKLNMLPVCLHYRERASTSRNPSQSVLFLHVSKDTTVTIISLGYFSYASWALQTWEAQTCHVLLIQCWKSRMQDSLLCDSNEQKIQHNKMAMKDKFFWLCGNQSNKITFPFSLWFFSVRPLSQGSKAKIQQPSQTFRQISSSLHRNMPIGTNHHFSDLSSQD